MRKKIFDLSVGDQFIFGDSRMIAEVVSPYGFKGIPHGLGRLGNTKSVADNCVYFIFPIVNRIDIHRFNKNVEVEVVP